MSEHTRFLDPDEQVTLDELPTTQRGAPKIWESRLQTLVGGDGKWTAYMEGRVSVLRATRSNFRAGRISKPEGHKFECEVVTLDGQDEDHGTLFFRWIGREDPAEVAKEKLEAHLAKLEKEINDKGAVLNDGGSDAGLVPGEERVPAPVASHLDTPEPAVSADLPVGLEDFASVGEGPLDETPPYTGPGALPQPEALVVEPEPAPAPQDEEVDDGYYESGLEDL